MYHAGLQVPDEVTPMWCDDNYGYIRHFPLQQKNVPVREETECIIMCPIGGVRMIIFGWELPILPWYTSKCLWHTSGGIQKMWILNVGDIKPAEYQVELFLDMAWNLEEVKQQGIAAHQRHFLEREFGKK